MPEEPIEILVQLAEKGEIDPWNIDIVEVTDRFLGELERRKELDLRISGRTLFYAAVLLRMKSEHLEELGIPDEDAASEEWEDSFSPSAEDPLADIFGEGVAGPIDRLEFEIKRRLERKNLRKRPITLFELILELKDAEKEERRRHRFCTPDLDRLVYADDVVSIAHDEGYQEATDLVLAQCEGAEGEGPITLKALCSEMGWPIADVYIPLLYLMYEGRLSLWQEEFFGEVYVARCPEGA